MIYTSKATQQGYIPKKVVRANKGLFSCFISSSFKSVVNKAIFPEELKHADITLDLINSLSFIKPTFLKDFLCATLLMSICKSDQELVLVI